MCASRPQVELPLVVGEKDTLEYCEELLTTTDHDSYPVVASRPDNMQVVGLMRRAAMVKAIKIAKGREDRVINFGMAMELCPWMVPDSMPANRAYKVLSEPLPHHLPFFVPGVWGLGTASKVALFPLCGCHMLHPQVESRQGFLDRV